MRRIPRFLAAMPALLLAAACAIAPQPAVSQPAPAAPAVPAPGAALPAFVCPDGQRLALDHDVPAGIMRVTRGGETAVMQQLVSRSGRLAFASGEDTLELFDGRMQLRRGRTVRQVCPAVPSEPTRGIIWGTLTKPDRMALTPGSRAKVLLVDAARADAPHVEIASATILTSGNQVPLHFLLRYDPARASPRPLTYRLMARIESPTGQLTHITDTALFVLEADQPVPPVELMLVRAGNPAG